MPVGRLCCPSKSITVDFDDGLAATIPGSTRGKIPLKLSPAFGFVLIPADEFMPGGGIPELLVFNPLLLEFNPELFVGADGMEEGIPLLDASPLGLEGVELAGSSSSRAKSKRDLCVRVEVS